MTEITFDIDRNLLFIVCFLLLIILVAGAVTISMQPYGAPPPVVEPPEPHMHP